MREGGERKVLGGGFLAKCQSLQKGCRRSQDCFFYSLPDRFSFGTDSALLGCNNLRNVTFKS